MPLIRFADFQGRSRRLEYWMFQLFFWLVTIALFMLFDVRESGAGSDSYGEELSSTNSVAIGLFLIFYVAGIIPSLAVTVRRLHDRGSSGWMILLGLIPYLGGLILFVMMLLPGDEGENEYGPDPKDPDADSRDKLEGVFR